MRYEPFMRELPEADYSGLKQAYDQSRQEGLLKRLTDIVIASFALIFLLPVLIPIALAIRLSDGGPAIFRQKRIGRDGKEFFCLKFRSMTVDADARLERLISEDPSACAEWRATQKLEHDPRITPFGNFLRKSSLDELPQLINILKGEMSLVGPRPIVRNEIEKYGEHFKFYSRVRPGLTGLWQVSGRSDTTYEERVALDVEYVNEQSYLKDLKIIAMTVPAVLLSDGAK